MTTTTIPALWTIGESQPRLALPPNPGVTRRGLRRCETLDLPIGWLFEKTGGFHLCGSWTIDDTH
jgi:hypothetical protein